MTIFSYKAKNARGGLVEGLVDAVSEETVANLLAEKGLAVIEIRRQEAEDLARGMFFWLNRVKIKDKVIFFRQLSVMIDANLPIVKALRILVKQTSNKYLKSVIASVADEVNGGAKLSQSLAKFPDVFSDFYVNIIASGETSGRLSEVMQYLADQQEKDYDLQSKVRGAMIYPAFIFGGLLLVGAVVMVFVIPQITQLLRESNVRLPLATRIMLGLADFARNYWWAVLTILGAVIGGFWFSINKTVGGRRAFDLLKIKMPVFGRIVTNIYIVRITRSLNTLLIGGVPAAPALRVTRRIVGNVIYEEIIDRAIKDVDEGGSLAESLITSRYLPALVSQMISVGEETGKLEEILAKVTNFYNREVDNAVANLSVLLEPIIMIILGFLVGGFVAAVIMPMWQLSAAF